MLTYSMYAPLRFSKNTIFGSPWAESQQALDLTTKKLLPPPTAEQLDAMRAQLRSGDAYRQLDVLETAWQYGAGAEPLVPDIAVLLTSQDYVPVSARKYDFSGHAPIAQSARSAIESIGVPPDLETLRALLADHRIFELPEASYDQGAYIGDYGTEYVAPAGSAARLCELMGLDTAQLLEPLGLNAFAENELISWPAQRAIMKLATLLGDPGSDPYAQAALAALATVIEALPEVVSPASKRGFALRDLAQHIRKKLLRTRV